jgi:hypothetical protein
MLKWTEYAIVRLGVQLRHLAAERPLTESEQCLLDICEVEIKRFEIRESQPAPEKPAPRERRRSFAKWSATRPPLANSRLRD